MTGPCSFISCLKKIPHTTNTEQRNTPNHCKNTFDQTWPKHQNTNSGQMRFWPNAVMIPPLPFPRPVLSLPFSSIVPLSLAPPFPRDSGPGSLASSTRGVRGPPDRTRDSTKVFMTSGPTTSGLTPNSKPRTPKTLNPPKPQNKTLKTVNPET